MSRLKIDDVKQALSYEDDHWEDIFDDSKFYDGVYLFFSFDLVNSTEFKSKYSEEWKKVFTRFYELVTNRMDKYHRRAFVWKYIGDEILFYLKVKSFEDIYQAPINSLNIIKDVISSINQEVPKSKNILFIKGTLWISGVRYYNPRDNNEVDLEVFKNIAFSAGDMPLWLDQQRIDFLGPDIDLGFRLSKFTQKRQLLISAELAYLLHRKNGDISSHGRQEDYRFDTNKCCKLIVLEQLKGIWNNRRYPIIWFNTEWDFDYDEYLDSKLVRIINDKEELVFCDYIPKVFVDLGKIDELEKTIKYIETLAQDDSKHIKYNISKEKLAEVHCAAICLDSQGRVMLAKRPSTKNRLQGKWEFGCGQLEMNQNIEECLRSNYKNDFNAKLDFLEDSPVPVTTYTVYVNEEERKVPGILFFAIILNPEEVTKDFNRSKHDEVVFVTMEQLKNIPESEVVENLHNSAEKAFSVYKSHI